jgi:FkbM family methyltransferase
MSFRSQVKRFFHRLGFDISEYDKNACGQNPFLDMQRFVPDREGLVIFDVGANRGQFVETLRLHYGRAQVHSFEPSPATFRQLAETAARLPRSKAWENGMGSVRGSAKLLENSHPTMSSMLELGEQGWGRVEKETTVEIRTVDDFCREHSIDHIGILKTDTQGFDLEALKGARQMMSECRIDLVYSELIFADLYKNLPPFDEFYRYLRENDFALVALYKMNFANHVAGWADALFVNKRLVERISASNTARGSSAGTS